VLAQRLDQAAKDDEVVDMESLFNRRESERAREREREREREKEREREREGESGEPLQKALV
jgi:hypothetical protein